jgi:hypothetical protein
MAGEIMRAHNKLFGVFARAAFINDPTSKLPSVADTLTAPGFEQAWNFSTSLLQPDLGEWAPSVSIDPDPYIH